MFHAAQYAQSHSNYCAGWIDKAKPRNSEDFISVGQAGGAQRSGSDLWMGGLQFAPARDFWVQRWSRRSADVIRIAYFDADHVMRSSKDSPLRLPGQSTDQRSDGSNALTGPPFSTHNTQVCGEYRADWLTFNGASGRDAVSAASGAALADETEVDLGAVWTLEQKRALHHGLRYGWVSDSLPTGDQRSTDLRLDINLPISPF